MRSILKALVPFVLIAISINAHSTPNTIEAKEINQTLHTNEYSAIANSISNTSNPINNDSISHSIFNISIFTNLLNLVHHLYTSEDQLVSLAQSQSTMNLSSKNDEEQLNALANKLESQRQALEVLIKAQQQFDHSIKTSTN